MTYEQRHAWLAERQTGVGASEIAAIAGLSPFGSALGVYLVKTGQLPPVEETPAMAWGTRLEQAIADAYTEETGRLLTTAELRRHPDEPWMLATVDRVADDRLVELKTASAFMAHEWGEPGTDQVPDAYLLQVNQQMAVTGYGRCDVAVLIGGQDFRRYELCRSPEIIARLTEIGAAFWERVLERRPPEPDWSHATTPALIEAMYPFREEAVELTEAAALLASDYERLAGVSREAEAERDTIKAQLIRLMDGASLGSLPDGRTINRKLVQRKEYLCAASEYYSFRIQAPKKARKRA